MVDPVADFWAEVDSSRSDAGGPQSMRVLVNPSQLVLATDETEQRISIGSIFDVSRGVNANRESNDETSLTLAYREGEIRETVTLRSDTDTMENFQIVLFKLLFAGVTASVRTDDKKGDDRFIEDVTLEPTRSALRFETGDGSLAIDHRSIAGFETMREAVDGDEQQPVLIVYWADERYDAKTVIVVQSFRLLNLFGRYMQSYAALAGRSAADGSIRLLLVDDDRHDLEMTEMLLREEEPRLTIDTCISASEALEAVASDRAVHCIVSDYDMPGTDGIELLQKVRKDRPELPFIQFTGQGSESVAKQAIISDATDYVEKGIGSKQYEILASRIRHAVT